MGNCCQGSAVIKEVNPIQIFHSIVVIQKNIRRFLAQKRVKRMKSAIVFIKKEKIILDQMNYKLEPYLSNDACLKNCYLNGYQISEIANGQDLYYGQTINGLKQGLGFQINQNNAYFIGQFKEDNPCGQGRLVTQEFYYEGQILMAQPNGRGKLINRNGTIWEGTWKDGKLQGRGKEIYYNGCHYEGEFQQGIKEGKGQLSYKDGSKFNGSFKNGKMDGQGQLMNLDNSGYIGQWSNGQPHGDGKLNWNGGGEYQGEFKFGLRDGLGQYLWNQRGNGQKYSGGWLNGKQHGQGCTTYNGRETQGLWQNGMQVQ